VGLHAAGSQTGGKTGCVSTSTQLGARGTGTLRRVVEGARGSPRPPARRAHRCGTAGFLRSLQRAVPDGPGWQRRASALIFEQPGARTLARLRRGLKVTSGVRTGGCIQAENQRQHLEPRGAEPAPCPAMHPTSPLSPGCPHGRDGQDTGRGALGTFRCLCSHPRGVRVAAASRGTLNFAPFAIERGKSSRHAGVMPWSHPGSWPGTTGLQLRVVHGVGGSRAGPGLLLPGSTKKHLASPRCRSCDWL